MLAYADSSNQEDKSLPPESSSGDTPIDPQLGGSVSNDKTDYRTASGSQRTCRNHQWPRTSATPNTPGSAPSLPSYRQQTSQPANRAGLYSMVQNQYALPHGYGTSTPTMLQATTTASHPRPIAPAPDSNREPHILYPLPPGGIISQPGVSSPYCPSSLMQPTSVLQEDDRPTHVVGSQGRRGILPSAPSRPAAPAAGTGGTKNTVIPVKDADGKFPCPHCTKTYLHAKHLKRHLLRHTGDRPYMCVLCRDTFCRSDILKRHFQKCSIRRGNPTGASHLSNPRVYVTKNAQSDNANGLTPEHDWNLLRNTTAENVLAEPGSQERQQTTKAVSRIASTAYWTGRA